MKVLLDENFPLRLLSRLRANGFTADHVITLGWRGASDARIRGHLNDQQILFLTQDDDFTSGDPVAATVVISRVRQSRLLNARIDIWVTAVQQFADAPKVERLFELMDNGLLVPWSDTAKGT